MTGQGRLDLDLDTSPISLTSEDEDEQEDRIVCQACNVTFRSVECLEVHKTSDNHVTVISDVFKVGKFNCFICAESFECGAELIQHNVNKDHVVNMQRQGITGLIKDEVHSVDLDLDKVSSAGEEDILDNEDLEPIDSPDSICDNAQEDQNNEAAASEPFENVDSPEQLPEDEDPEDKSDHHELEDVDSPEKLSEILEEVNSPEESFEDPQEILEHNDDEFLVIDSID